MVKKRTSRVINMNDFDYSLIRSDTYVKEINRTRKTTNGVWNIKELTSLDEIYNVGDKPEMIEFSKSFKRTKKWLQENYPELMI